MERHDIGAERTRIRAGGSERGHARLREQNKLFVRDRIDLLFDADTFVEDAMFAGPPSPRPSKGEGRGAGTCTVQAPRSRLQAHLGSCAVVRLSAYQIQIIRRTGERVARRTGLCSACRISRRLTTLPAADASGNTMV